MNETFAYPVVSMIVEHRDSSGRILLQRRIKTEPGQLMDLLELPQGRLRRGESITECAERELREETGLEEFEWNTKPIQYLSQGEALQAVSALVVNETGFHSYLALCVIGRATGQPRDSDESSEPDWYTKNEVRDLLASNSIFALNVPMLIAYLGC